MTLNSGDRAVTRGGGAALTMLTASLNPCHRVTLRLKQWGRPLLQSSRLGEIREMILFVNDYRPLPRPMKADVLTCAVGSHRGRSVSRT